MKRLLIYLSFLISFNLYSQSIQNSAVEIYFGTTEVKPPSKKITLYMIAQGTVWGGTSGPPKAYWISND